MKGEVNVAWKRSYCKTNFMSTYFRVKAHLLSLPSCGIASCTKVHLVKRK